MGLGKGHRLVDLTGRRFGRLLVLRRGENYRCGTPRWACVCDCGNERLVSAGALVRGVTVSCGCHRREKLAEARAKASAVGLTHGMSGSPEYGVWRAMLSRCRNPKVRSYGDYGGRGIKVCERWANSFAAFFADMGPRPGPGFEIDRKDNDGDYEPANCRWATKAEQSVNRRDTRLLTHGGETMSLRDWADRTAIPYATIQRRLGRGWSAEQVLTTPVDASRRNRRAGALPAVPERLSPQPLGCGLDQVPGQE